jgi:hypothetical protein
MHSASSARRISRAGGGAVLREGAASAPISTKERRAAHCPAGVLTLEGLDSSAKEEAVLVLGSRYEATISAWLEEIRDLLGLNREDGEGSPRSAELVAPSEPPASPARRPLPAVVVVPLTPPSARKEAPAATLPIPLSPYNPEREFAGRDKDFNPFAKVR